MKKKKNSIKKNEIQLHPDDAPKMDCLINLYALFGIPVTAQDIIQLGVDCATRKSVTLPNGDEYCLDTRNQLDVLRAYFKRPPYKPVGGELEELSKFRILLPTRWYDDAEFLTRLDIGIDDLSSSRTMPVIVVQEYLQHVDYESRFSIDINEGGSTFNHRRFLGNGLHRAVNRLTDFLFSSKKQRTLSMRAAKWTLEVRSKDVFTPLYTQTISLPSVVEWESAANEFCRLSGLPVVNEQPCFYKLSRHFSALLSANHNLSNGISLTLKPTP